MNIAKKLSKKELENINEKLLRDLNLLTLFYFDCVTNQRGVIKKPSPKQLVRFLKKHQKNESRSKL